MNLPPRIEGLPAEVAVMIGWHAVACLGAHTMQLGLCAVSEQRPAVF